jgi:predicted Zn-ribbon and HTH transcriptional regulator
MARAPTKPAERSSTSRERLREALLATVDTGASVTLRELSSAAGISEKDIAQHLEHLARSLKNDGFRLEVEPASCIACEHVFKDRQRYTTPGACPACRSERVAPPSFWLRAQGRKKTDDAT